MPSYRIYETRDTGATGFASDGVAVSGANTYYSLKMKPALEGLLGFRLSWTGTPTGTFTLWYTDKDNPDLTSDADWTQDTSWTPVNPAGSASNAVYSVSGLKVRWARVKYVNSASSGVLFGNQGA